MALVCLGGVWLLQPRERFVKALIGVLAFLLLAAPAGMHARMRLGFFAPFGNAYPVQIYALSGRHNIELDLGTGGHWGYGSPSFYSPTFYPFSDWTSDRQGTVSVKIDLARGREGWLAERARTARESTFSGWQRLKENLLYLLFAQSWPDNNLDDLSGQLTVWSRWLWPVVMLYVAWGAVVRGYRGREWLLPACALGMLIFLALQTTAIIEARYRKPIDPVLVAAAVVLYCRTRKVAPTLLSPVPA
jgi:hypothetical protein